MLGQLLKLGIHLDSGIKAINCRQIGDPTFAPAALLLFVKNIWFTLSSTHLLLRLGL